MVLAATVDASAARAALAAIVPRLTALVRSIQDPTAPALGEWNVVDVAVHLAHVWETLPALARGELSSPLRDPRELAGLTASMVRREPVRDLEATAARIEAAASAYLATPLAEGGMQPWLVEGTTVPATTFSCHILNESLVHGHDIAHAERRRWPIDPAHAGMALMGFVFPALSIVDPHFPVDQRYADVRARFDIRVRHTGRIVLVLDAGTAAIEQPSERPVDCHLSAEPTTLFLLVWGRTSQWPGALTGRLSAWGKRPWLAIRLPRMLHNP